MMLQMMLVLPQWESVLVWRLERAILSSLRLVRADTARSRAY